MPESIRIPLSYLQQNTGIFLNPKWIPKIQKDYPETCKWSMIIQLEILNIFINSV